MSMIYCAPALGVGSIGPLEAMWLVAILVAFVRGIFKARERGS
jgi:hypothetical protein